MVAEWLLIVAVVVVAVVAAFPLAIGVSILGGSVLMTIDWLTTRCPHCGAKRMMTWVNGIRTTYPTGRGTGSFFRCRACGRRAFWSRDLRAWKDATGPEFDRWFEPKVGPQPQEFPNRRPRS